MLLPPDLEPDVEDAFGFTVLMAPRGKERPRARLVKKKDGSSGLGAHQPKGNATWKKEFLFLTATVRRSAARCIASINASNKGAGAPLRIELELYYTKPKTGTWFCTSSIDNDNAEKMVWDAMQGAFFKNDNRIVSNETMKAWTEGAPFLRVRVIPLRRKIR